MIKFNRIIRASVLSLAISGAALFAGHANAYTAGELSDAEAAVSTAQTGLDDAEADYEAKSDYYDEVSNYLSWWIGYCQSQPGGMPIQCYYDTNDYYDYTVYPAMQARDNAQTAIYYAYWTLNDATTWRDYVANHQNGIPGQP